MQSQTKKKFNIYVKIVNSNLCEENKFPFNKKFNLYTIKINTNDGQREISRRYTNFYELHEKLKNKKIVNLPKLPPKKIFPSETELFERKQKLQKYLNSLLTRDDAYKHNEILEFIEMEKEHYLMLKDNVDSLSTNENSPNLEKVKSFIELKKSKSSDIKIKKNFFYSNFAISAESSDDERVEENPIRSLISIFLKNLNYNPKEKCKIVQDFEEKLNVKKINHVFQRDEVYKLLFGDNFEEGFLGGLIYHCGRIDENEIGAGKCLEFLSKLMDYQHNLDCEFFISILRLAKIPQIKSMKLDEHLKTNKKKVLNSCFTILKAIVHEEKGISINSILVDQKIIEKYCKEFY